ncbi:MAG: glutamate--tRNA ligase, partial [Nitrospinota bacterium]
IIKIDSENLEILKDNTVVEVLKSLKDRIEKEENITEEIADKIILYIKEKTNIKGKKLMMPIRIALTGKTEGPELKKIFPLLGKERIIKRIESALINQ